MDLMAEILRLIFLFGFKLRNNHRDLLEEQNFNYNFFPDIKRELKVGN
jgi:hypothetical protein